MNQAFPPPDAEREPPPFLEFAVRAYTERWRAAAMAAAIMLAALVVSALIPPQYRATATLAVLPAPEFTVREPAGSHAQTSSALAIDQVMKAETEILGSDDLHEAVIAQIGLSTVYPGLASTQKSAQGSLAVLRSLAAPWFTPPRDAAAAAEEQALRRFRSDLLVLPSRDANVIKVGFTGLDPAVAARVVNGMLSLYAARRAHLYDDPQAEVVRGETEGVSRAAEDADARLADFKRAHELANYDAERDLLLGRRNEVAVSRLAAEVAQGEQHARIEALDRLIRSEPATAPIYQEHDSDSRVLSIDASVQDMQGRLAVLRQHYQDRSRMVQDLRAQIADRRLERARIARDPSPSLLRAGPSAAADALRQDRARAVTELAAARSRVASLAGEEGEIGDQLLQLASEEVTLDGLVRRRDAADDTFRAASRILAERRLTEAEDTLRLANVRVIQAARVPQRPTGVKFLVIIAGALLALAGALAWVVGCYTFRPVFLTAEGLAHATGLPVLAVFREDEFELQEG